MTEAGGLSKIIDERRGYYVIQLIEKKPVTFEEQQGELFRLFMEKPPHAGEVFKLKEQLRRESNIVKRF